ncbi:MAG: LysR family transcriptional regulator [Blautia sp.]|nr:LysR family transcriptional regulator [Blautia sp.]
MMDLKQLQYFLTSARLGSFSKAAEELYTTQPHVSLVIKQLEQEVGTALVERLSTGIRLTEAGEHIRFYAENVLRNADMILETCHEAGESCLRIASHPSSSLAFLAGDFFHEREEAGMSLRYTECNGEEMMRLLAEERYDLGLLFVPLYKLGAFTRLAEKRHLVYQPLLETDLVLHCSENSRFYGRETVTPEELDQCECIQLEDDFFSVEDLLVEAPAFRKGKCSLHKVIRTNSDHMMIRMLQTTALCNIGSYWHKSAYGKYRFSMTKIEGFEKQISFGCLRPDNQQLRPEAEAFLERVTSFIQI